MHVGHKISDREIDLGSALLNNTIRVGYHLTSVDFKLPKSLMVAF